MTPTRIQLIGLQRDKQNQMAQSTHPQAETLITETEVNTPFRNVKESLSCVSGVLQELMEGSWEQIKLNRLFSRCLQAYSNVKTMDNMQELNTFLFSEAPPMHYIKSQEEEPVPLTIDSLLPISADIDPENTYKKNNSSRKLLQEDSVTRSRIGDRASIEQRQKYTKLQLTEVSEEDGFTKELRKLEEQSNMKAQGERKASQRKRQLQEQKLRDKKKNQKEEKFSYDYNGEVIEIKLQSKTNLISKVINGATNPNPTITKEIIKDPRPIDVEPTNRKQKKLFAGMGKRKDDVEFSEVKSLAENIKATQGVKYTYEGKTYEEKQKAVSVAQLRKTISQRRISKDDYKRIRELNGNKQDYEEALKKSRLDAGNRPQSEQKRGVPTPTITKRKERIHVNSNDLKGKLLEKPPQQEYLTERNQLSSEGQGQGEERIGSIDTFNLEYLRTGGTIHAATSKEFFRQRSDNELPRITHTTLYSKVLPKGRERIKEANEIIRDLRKKFQEKLRV